MVRFVIFLVIWMMAGILLQAQELVQIDPAEAERRDITTAVISSRVQANAASSLGMRGFCYSQEPAPTLAHDYVEAGRGAGSFKQELTGLKKATVYYVRPFVMVDSAAIYGKQLTFTTHAFLNGARIELRFVEGSPFRMGCRVNQHLAYGDEFPVHQVELGDFQISTYEVTCSQYCAFLNSKSIPGNGIVGDLMYLDMLDSDCPIRHSGGQFVPEPGKGDHPLTEVTWFGAQAFCEWMGGRLPTEAEWEYAAKGGKKHQSYQYSGSNDIDQVAWYQDNSQEGCHPVGEKKPNELGLYDMSGNAWEWCYDWYLLDYYGRSPMKNPLGPKSGKERVIRGGAWNMDSWNCRVSNRSSKPPQITYNYYGFRLVIP